MNFLKAEVCNDEDISREEILVDGNKTSTGHWIKAGQRIELLESSANPPKEYILDLEIVLYNFF